MVLVYLALLLVLVKRLFWGRASGSYLEHSITDLLKGHIPPLRKPHVSKAGSVSFQIVLTSAEKSFFGILTPTCFLWYSANFKSHRDLRLLKSARSLGDIRWLECGGYRENTTNNQLS
ncbi:unnamed protein product [Acanthoscelides obtectus]|uniref:Secreted protein n=1 Tax=Acanthoscelides obtectus TaxID=200917 RepID=A0A9P0JKL3_ACAOB|nr:unnamed protein product [Acanthoscelides obtectus]CAK1678693.1 hypothetical protein AOBTE_LOCUS32001 [Acanthoscelides obtectus]